MNYNINNLPERTAKPRDKGITMVMDKGLSLRQVEDFLEVGGPYTDIVKLGWATSYVTPNLTEKIKLYQQYHQSKRNYLLFKKNSLKKNPKM